VNNVSSSCPRDAVRKKYRTPGVAEFFTAAVVGGQRRPSPPVERREVLACTAQCSCMSGHGGTWIRSALYSQSLRSLLPMPSPPQRLLGVVLLGCLLYTPGIPNATEKRYLSCAPLSCIQFVPYGGASDAHPHPSEPLPKGNDTYNPSHSLGTRGNHIRLIVTTTLSVAGLLLGTHGRATTDSTGHTQRPIISTVYIDCAEI